MLKKLFSSSSSSQSSAASSSANGHEKPEVIDLKRSEIESLIQPWTKRYSLSAGVLRMKSPDLIHSMKVGTMLRSELCASIRTQSVLGYLPSHSISLSSPLSADDGASGEDSGHSLSPTARAEKLLLQLQQYDEKVHKITDLIKTPEFFELLRDVAAAASRLFAAEKRVLRMKSPAYVWGDLHGSYHDILFFEKSFMHSIEANPSRFLFLGDYVDRGKHSLATIARLLAFKVLYPNRVFLLRGNHEVRSINMTYGFNGECKELYGDSLGEQMFDLINRCFCYLPLAALIDDCLYCSHGGFPRPAGDSKKDVKNRLFLIDSIPVPISAESWNKENMIPNDKTLTDQQRDAIADILWSDPAEGEAAEAGLDADGFGPNTSRGAGSLFGSRAVENFLSAHSLSHVLRAHQMQNVGVSLAKNGKVVTVFSSANYSGGNLSGCLLIADDKISVIIKDPLGKVLAE